MSKLHQTVAPWEWSLAPGQATRIAPEGRARWLAVTTGRVWLTQSGTGAAGADVWLEAGARHRLPAGTEWVAEGWPQATLELLEAPQPRDRGVSAVARRWRVWPPVLHAA
jgi:hypothetical protein